MLSSSLVLHLAFWVSAKNTAMLHLAHACNTLLFALSATAQSRHSAHHQQRDMIFMLWCRDGEESRTYLIGCTEAYLAKHPTDGYDPSKSDSNLSWLRPSIDQQALKRDQSLPNGRSHHVSTHRHTLTACHFMSDMFLLSMRYI